MKTMHRKIKANNDNIKNMELTEPYIYIYIYIQHLYNKLLLTD